MYNDNMITNSQGKKCQRKPPCKCLSIIMLDSNIKAKRGIILKHFWRNVNMNKKQ